MPRGVRGSARPKPPSRNQQWETAASEAFTAAEAIREKIETLKSEIDGYIEEKTSEIESRIEEMISEADIDALQDDLVKALEDLKGLQEEYSEWKDKIEEKMSNTVVYEKLDTICNMDFSTDFEWSNNLNVEVSCDIENNIDDILNIADEAQNADLPLGFGRD